MVDAFPWLLLQSLRSPFSPLHPMLSEYSVRNAYQEAYKRGKMEGDSLPRAAAVQELVTVWKQLWEWRRR
jgi:hypothetical protein